MRSAQASLGGASAERRNAQAGLARSRRVFEAGIAPRQEVDDAEAHLASARAAEELARAALEQAQRQRGFATVASPLGGVVLKVFAKAGELVDGTAATPIVEVADLGALELVADAPARDLARLAAGQAASVTFDGLPSPLGATVARVAPAIDRASGFGSVHLLLAPAAARPPVGAYGRAAVAVGDARAGLFVPAVAVTSPSDGRGRVMLCGADHRARAVVVALGPTRAGETEVTGELRAGDAVVIEPALGVADGDRLELEAGDAPASGPDPSDPADAAP
ncbi:MAG: efflux RND transporter periplasmic adaptor subunit [Myxococcota bacterium]